MGIKKTKTVYTSEHSPETIHDFIYLYIIIRKPLTLKISVSLPHVYLLKGMLEKVVLETENS